MYKLSLPFLLLLAACNSYAQTATDIIALVKKAQQQLKTVTYTLQRNDTLVTGDIRNITGEVNIAVNSNDTLLGFLFHGKRDGINIETVYDGNSVIDVNHDTKTYRITNASAGYYFFGSPGGQVVLPDVVRLDTSKATGFELKEDAQYYYLTIHLPDIKEYDVSNRYHLITIDKKLMLPLALRSHQETLGKVQDLQYKVKQIWVNDDAHAYDFSAERFPAAYHPESTAENETLKALQNNPAPLFTLSSFDNKTINPFNARKPLLLDFWEVWCGPCVASMPKVQQLYDKYKSKGLQVYGITNEKEQFESAKKLVAKKAINFPMLMGNDDIKKLYGVIAIPLYVLVDKEGKVCFTSEGYSDELENVIQKNL